MKISSLLLLTILSIQAFGDEEIATKAQDSAIQAPEPQPECFTPCIARIEPLIEAKVGYFFFTDSTMRKVYNEGGIDVQLSGRYPIYKWLQVYGSVEFAERHGKSLGAGQKTNIWLVPLSLGLQAATRLHSKVEYYFTLGPRWVFVHAHNDSTDVDKNVGTNGIAGFANTGFMFFPCQHLSIDIFGEYSYYRGKVHPHKTNVFSNTVQMGGFTFGAGVGYAF